MDAGVLKAMTTAVAHRGPDGEGIWTEGPIGIGHRRLAIRDLSDTGRQPMTDAAGRVVLSYNGEIYNDSELRRELELEIGYQFRSTSDTEVIVAGWLAWGEDVFARIQGMFAAIVWDRRTSTLCLARDAVGIKPLYRVCTPEAIIVGSEIKALWPSVTAKRRISPTALHAFLAQGYVSPTGSLIEGVGQVAPGTIEVFRNGTWQQRRFWTPQRIGDIATIEDAATLFLKEWREAVPRVLVSDVPVGVLQSGGIDSSLVSTMACRSRPGLPLFVASFEERSHDESNIAERVASAADSPLTIVPVEIGDETEGLFLSVVRHFDGQVADASAIAAYPLCRAVRRHVAVALSGDGADEFFGGYTTYFASRLAHLVQRFVPVALAAQAGQWLANWGGNDERRLPPLQVLSRLLLGLAGHEPHTEWRRHIPAFMLKHLYGPELWPEMKCSPLSGYEAAMKEGATHLDACLLADQGYYLPADMLMKVDAMSMAHGLEIRVPFLTPAIIEVASRIASAALCPPGGQPKAPLRRALEALGVPPSVTRRPKRGFNVPVDRLLRGGLANLGTRLLDRSADNLAPWLSPPAVRRLWRQHQDRERSWGYALWTLLTFAVWRESLSDV